MRLGNIPVEMLNTRGRYSFSFKLGEQTVVRISRNSHPFRIKGFQMNDVGIREGPPRVLKEISVAINTLSQRDKTQKQKIHFSQNMDTIWSVSSSVYAATAECILGLINVKC